MEFVSLKRFEWSDKKILFLILVLIKLKDGKEIVFFFLMYCLFCIEFI